MHTPPAFDGNPTDLVETDLSVQQLSVKRTEELNTFYIALQNPVLRQQVEDDETFAMVMQLAIDDYGVSQMEVAEVLQTQSSTVGRWKLGRAVPSVYSRAGIMTAIASLLSQHIADRGRS